MFDEFTSEEDADNADLTGLGNVEAKHYSELVSSLKTLAEKLKEDCLARKEEVDREGIGEAGVYIHDEGIYPRI